MMPCEHLNFETGASVTRFPHPDKPMDFRVDFKVRCSDCGLAFMFLDVPHIGFAAAAPSLDVSRQELSIRIAPWDGAVATHASYEVPA